MLTSINVKFIFDRLIVHINLGLFSSVNILQNLDRCRPLSCLFAVLAMFSAII